jgi:hypothetical protein
LIRLCSRTGTSEASPKTFDARLLRDEFLCSMALCKIAQLKKWAAKIRSDQRPGRITIERSRALSRFDERSSGARQDNLEFGELARRGVDRDGAAVLFDNDVVTDG